MTKKERELLESLTRGEVQPDDEPDKLVALPGPFGGRLICNEKEAKSVPRKAETVAAVLRKRGVTDKAGIRSLIGHDTTELSEVLQEIKGALKKDKTEE